MMVNRKANLKQNPTFMIDDTPTTDEVEVHSGILKFVKHGVTMSGFYAINLGSEGFNPRS